jgi:filamentous hemagglutinin family protein
MAHGPRWTQGRQEAGGQETGGQETGRLFDAARRRRSVLLLGTALQATASLLLVTPGRAQPAVNARPSGGVVTAGSASIGTSASTTTITQSSQRAAINWQSFNVGAQQTVDFVQPSSSSVALNRVISSDPSQIAGHIDANGQIILINQSGVIFYHGAQVNTAGLIVSAAGMSDVNFMAGKLVFDQAARPNAAVVNQGTLTVQQAGLAALVAPRVANSGVIDAKLGQVVLAGAKTATLDLYGDGLLALDVSNAVTQVPIGANGQKVTALVTNTGVIEADGGSVQLTARAADGLVQNLVQAGGKIVADSVGSKTGTVVLGGLGGSIVLSGVVSADGSAPGSHGGQVQADASEGVKLATGSRISASGPAGGGTVAVGTTLARAAGGPGTASALTAKTVQVDQGASIAADATSNGDGGRVTVLSSLSTSMAGKISANGGPLGGNGGFVEVSGEQGFALTGSIDVSAQLGNLGTILLDPTNLTIIAGATGDGDQDGNLTTNGGTILASGPDTTNDTVSNGAIDGLTGNVLLQATQSITINANAPISLTATAGQALTLEAGGTIAVHASITATGDIILATGGAGPGTAPPAMASPLIVVQNAAVTSTGGSVSLLAGPGGTVALGGIIGNIVTSGTLTAASGKLVTLQMDTLAVAGPASLITAPSGAIEIAPATPDTDVTLAGAGGLSITAAALAHMSTGTLRIGAATINGTRTRTAASITVAGTVDLAGIATTLELDAGGPITGTAAPLLNVGTLIASGTVINLQNPSNTITNLGNVTGNTFELDDDTNLTVLGTVNGGTTATISDSGGVLAISGTVSAGAISLAGLTLTITGETTDGGSGTTNLLAYTGGIAETGGTVIAGTLTGSSVGSVSLGVTSANTITTLGAFGVSAPAGSFALTDTRSLSITGAVSAQNGIYIESAGAAGIQLGAAASVTTGGGVIVGFQADAFSIANGGTVVGVGAQFELAPNTQGLGVTLGASGIGAVADHPQRHRPNQSAHRRGDAPRFRSRQNCRLDRRRRQFWRERNRAGTRCDRPGDGDHRRDADRRDPHRDRRGLPTEHDRQCHRHDRRPDGDRREHHGRRWRKPGADRHAERQQPVLRGRDRRRHPVARHDRRLGNHFDHPHRRYGRAHLPGRGQVQRNRGELGHRHRRHGGTGAVLGDQHQPARQQRPGDRCDDAVGHQHRRDRHAGGRRLHRRAERRHRAGGAGELDFGGRSDRRDQRNRRDAGPAGHRTGQPERHPDRGHADRHRRHRDADQSRQ